MVMKLKWTQTTLQLATMIKIEMFMTTRGYEIIKTYLESQISMSRMLHKLLSPHYTCQISHTSNWSIVTTFMLGYQCLILRVKYSQKIVKKCF